MRCLYSPVETCPQRMVPTFYARLSSIVSNSGAAPAYVATLTSGLAKCRRKSNTLLYAPTILLIRCCNAATNDGK